VARGAGGGAQKGIKVELYALPEEKKEDRSGLGLASRVERIEEGRTGPSPILADLYTSRGSDGRSRVRLGSGRVGRRRGGGGLCSGIR
jgi:hypothetical protein